YALQQHTLQKYKHKPTLSFVTPVAIIIIISGLGMLLSPINWVAPNGKTAKVALVQGNIEQAIKWVPEQEWPTMLKYLDLTSVNYNADIIIWPESAIPAIEPSAQDFLTTVNRSAILNNSAVITGILNYNFETRQYFNSLIVLGKKQLDDEQGYFYNHSNRYSKHHLLPIGEFVPFQEWLRPIAPLFNLPMSSFSRGDYQQHNLIAKGLNILPLLCFEIAFPHQLAANLTNKTDLLLTVSNDAWFGDSHGPHQHMEIARMRALEFGRPLLRSTNNGITAVVDHQGKFIARIPQFKEAVLTATVPLVTGETPYSQWPRLILFMMIVMPFAIVMLLQCYLLRLF
ncbi:MAG: apolipoprotein N-acyltransferase, partial [Colwellia sp.]|nr:apolipoprotein N-acyltransferase [Colwellia sp.]